MNYSDTRNLVAGDRAERRLTAILVADVAGYSRLMHAEEEATHSRVMALLTNTVMPAIAGFGGGFCQMAMCSIPELMPNKFRHIGIALSDGFVFVRIPWP